MGNKVTSQTQVDYQHSINKLVDRQSGQSVMGRFELYPLWSTKVKGDPPYDSDLAQAMLTRHRRKRQRSDRAMQPVRRKCAAFFLVDRIHFRGYHFSEWLSYREILEFHRCFPLGHVFVLYVIDRKMYGRSYQSFECVYADEADRLEEFIRKIMSDPQRLIQTTASNQKDLVSKSLILPHSTYRDETGYYAYHPQDQDLDSSYSWESVSDDNSYANDEDDKDESSENMYTIVSGYRNWTDDKREYSARSTPLSSIPSVSLSRGHHLTNEQLAALPVARKVVTLN